MNSWQLALFLAGYATTVVVVASLGVWALSVWMSGSKFSSAVLGAIAWLLLTAPAALGAVVDIQRSGTCQPGEECVGFVWFLGMAAGWVAFLGFLLATMGFLWRRSSSQRS